MRHVVLTTSGDWLRPLVTFLRRSRCELRLADRALRLSPRFPVLVALYIDRDRRRVASQAEFGNPDLIPNVVDRSPGRLRYLPPLTLLVALVFLIVGVARPHATVDVQREEATIVLAIDVSRSMKANDVEPTRLDAARVAAKTFLDEVPEKFQVGVVSFATRAVVGVAPTEDRDSSSRRSTR